MAKQQRQRQELASVEIRRPDASHPWGICYAVLPSGPEILKVMNESPAYGRLRSGQVIKTINGQSVLGLKREDITDLLNIDDEVVVLEITPADSNNPKSLFFAREYGRGSVEPGSFSRTCRRNSEMSTTLERRGSNACVEMPTNLPNCRDEFERIHSQRKQSRELTFSQMENLRLQRAASVDICDSDSRSSSTLRPQQSLQPGALVDPQREEDNGMTRLRYMGAHIPSRSFKALALLMGMDPSDTNIGQQSTKPSSAEPCRTVIDVRATAEAMRKGSLGHSSINGSGSVSGSLPPHPPSTCNSSVKAL
uniref:Pdz domain containing protein n=1 Tax=Echinococcus granulosus TaxID=6210 RepID=A0A068WWH1_ECHGR|nr:pdz domain containing protein [Echinococcus granulosus]